VFSQPGEERRAAIPTTERQLFAGQMSYSLGSFRINSTPKGTDCWLALFIELKREKRERDRERERDKQKWFELVGNDTSSIIHRQREKFIHSYACK